MVPECLWADAVALLAEVFASQHEPGSLMNHATIIGDDLEGWGVVEILGEDLTAKSLASFVLSCMVSDIYTAGDDGEPAMRSLLYSAASAWSDAIRKRLDEVTA